jgi:DNA primase
MISKETIEEVKNRVDIVDVVSDFISLKRFGQNYKALSPFTNEKTPSFYVVPAKGIFKDFSSGKGGDAISFVIEHEGMSYLEAIKYLAKKYGVEIKEDRVQPVDQIIQDNKDSLYLVMNYAKDCYRDNLFNSDEGKSIGLSYFRERGFNNKTVEKFDLGYSINEWDNLFKKAIKSGYSEDILEKSGLLIKKDDGKKYDRFRGRVMFPVHNLSGKVIAFGARILTKEKDQPKYINSPETDIYHKSQVLYGIFHSKNAIRQEDFCYLVEGYTDVNSMFQAGVENVVASSGTALTAEQINLMRRFTENVTVLFDGDQAGIRAALRGIDLVLKAGLNVKVVLLPDGEDPDSFSKKLGSSEFKSFLNSNSKDFLTFKAELYADEAKKDPIKKADLIRELAISIAQIPSHLKREVYINECCKKFEISFQALIIEVNRYLIEARSEKISGHHATAKSLLLTPQVVLTQFEREYLKVLINKGFESTYVHEEDKEFKHGFDYLLNEASAVEFMSDDISRINEIYHKEALTMDIDRLKPKTFIKALNTNDVSFLSNLLESRYSVSRGWEKHQIFIGEEYSGSSMFRVVTHWKLRFVQKMIEDTVVKLKSAKSAVEEDDLIATIQRIDSEKIKYASQLGTVILPDTSLSLN